MSTSLSVLLANEFHPPRASRVCPRLPAWLTEAMNDAYEPEILKLCGRRLRNADEAEDFLRVIERECGCRPFDHRGSDAAGNFVCEPYAARCETCLAATREFARRLRVRFTTTTPTWHAPESEECVRIVFCKPRGAR